MKKSQNDLATYIKDVQKLGNKFSVKDPSPKKELLKENDVKEKTNSNRDSRQSFEEIVKNNKISFRKDINGIKIILIQLYSVKMNESYKS